MSSASRLLVVEDSPSKRKTISEILKPLGYEIDQATNGKEAIALLHRHSYALIVTDLLMPESTGFDLLEALRKRSVKIPIIICTAYLTQDVQKNAGIHELTEMVSKPFKPGVLFDAAKGLLERATTTTPGENGN